MKRSVITYLITAAFLLGLAAGPAWAQQETSERNFRGGTDGAQYLLLPGTARTAALGTAVTGGLETLGGLEALQTNPAGLAFNEGTSALFSRMNYVADIGTNTFGVAQQLNNNNIALVISNWDLGDIPVTSAESPEVTELSYTAPILLVGLSYARAFTDRIAAGVTVKLLNEEIQDMSARGIVFDAGLSYTVGETGLRFGVSLRNFGPQMTYGGDGLSRLVTLEDQEQGAADISTQIEAESYELPSLLNFGASYKANLSADAAVTVMGNFRSNAYVQNQYGGGLEFAFRELVFVRGGYQAQADMDRNDFEGWNVGGGLNLDIADTALSVDYAYRPMERLGEAHLVTAGVTL